jgi:hypothetical protein
MKLLQCSHCKRYAVGPPTRNHPTGEPLVIGQVSSGLITFKCNRCKKTTRNRSVEIASLPELSIDELKALGFSYLTDCATVESKQGEPLG